MENVLRLWLERDDDGTGELFAFVSAKHFSGIGSAWFDVSAIADFARSLLTYPLPAAGLPPLEGGYWDKDNRGKLAQTHLSIRFYPIGHSGRIGCLVKLSSPQDDPDRPESLCHVQTELETTYEQLSVFSRHLSTLASAETDEAVFTGNPV